MHNNYSKVEVADNVWFMEVKDICDLHSLSKADCVLLHCLFGIQLLHTLCQRSVNILYVSGCILSVVTKHEYFTFSHLADALIQSDLQKVQGHSPQGK